MQHAARLAFDGSRELEFGLELMLDGLEREVKDVGWPGRAAPASAAAKPPSFVGPCRQRWTGTTGCIGR